MSQLSEQDEERFVRILQKVEENFPELTNRDRNLLGALAYAFLETQPCFCTPTGHVYIATGCPKHAERQKNR